MKKIIMLAICALAIVSCKKNNDTEQSTQMVTISFDQRIVSGNSMVRSTSNDFLDIIEEQTPKAVTVWLKNTDLNKTYHCESAESITIPVGNYKISAQSYTNLSDNMLYTKPMLKMPETATSINANTDKITLNLSYNCYAIFALIDECRYVEAQCSNFSDTELPKVGKYYVGYFHHDGITINILPYTDSSEFTANKYTFVTTYNPNDTFAEYGKYYVVHPTKIDSTTSSFEVNMPTMEEGEI